MKQAGLLPVAVPNAPLRDGCSSAMILEEWLHAVKPNALFLSGGYDIGDFPDRLLADALTHFVVQFKRGLPRFLQACPVVLRCPVSISTRRSSLMISSGVCLFLGAAVLPTHHRNQIGMMIIHSVNCLADNFI